MFIKSKSQNCIILILFPYFLKKQNLPKARRTIKVWNLDFGQFTWMDAYGNDGMIKQTPKYDILNFKP